MNEEHHFLRLVEPEDWVQRFIRCQLRELDGEELTPEDAAFVASIEAAATTMPGLLEDALLKYGLTPAASNARHAAPEPARPREDTAAAGASHREAVARYGVAAASPEPVYQQVVEAIEEGKDSVYLEMGGDSLEVLQITSPTGPVKPLFHEGYTFVVERAGAEPQTITPYGGVYLSLEELRGMFLEYNAKDKTIRLYHA
jgi:hypothetical protein